MKIEKLWNLLQSPSSLRQRNSFYMDQLYQTNDFENHPTLRFLLNQQAFPIRVRPQNVLAYEHTPNATRKTIQFLIETNFRSCEVQTVGVKAFIYDETQRTFLEKPELIYNDPTCTIESEYNYRVEVKLDKPKYFRGVSLCFLRFYIRLHIQNDEISSIEVPIPICTHKTRQSIECDLCKLFPNGKPITLRQLAHLMANYQKWATKPIEEIEVNGRKQPKIRIPEAYEWETMLYRLGEKPTVANGNDNNNVQNVQSSLKNESSFSSNNPSLCNKYSADSVKVMLSNWTLFIDLLNQNDDIRQLWNEGHIFICTIEMARTILTQLDSSQCPVGSFLFKFGMTWFITNKAGPIIVVEKINKDGHIEIQERYLTYEALKNYGLGYLILNDNTESKYCQFWINKYGECISKHDTLKSPFRLKPNTSLNPYDKPLYTSNKSPQEFRKRTRSLSEERITVECGGNCHYDDKLEWRYCPMCGKPLKRDPSNSVETSPQTTRVVDSLSLSSDLSRGIASLWAVYSESTNNASESVGSLSSLTLSNKPPSNEPVHIVPSSQQVNRNLVSNSIDLNDSNFEDTLSNPVDTLIVNGTTATTINSNINASKRNQSSIENVFSEGRSIEPEGEQDIGRFLLSDEEVSHLSTAIGLK